VQWLTVDSGLCSGSIDGHGMQHLVEQLEGTMQMHLDPAGRLLDWLSWIIRSPSLDKAQSQYTKTTQIIDSNASSSRNAYNSKIFQSQQLNYSLILIHFTHFCQHHPFVDWKHLPRQLLALQQRLVRWWPASASADGIDANQKPVKDQQEDKLNTSNINWYLIRTPKFLKKLQKKKQEYNFRNPR